MVDPSGGDRVVCEPTGGYERAAVRWLHGIGVSVHVAHPNRVRRFARAAGHHAKTDALDARMLVRYGAVFPMPCPLAKEADREVVQDLLRRRKPLVQQRVQESQRLDKGPTEGARASIERHLKWLDEEIAQVEEAYRAAVKNNASLAASAALYQSVPGVGELTAATLVGYLPELGQWSGKEVTARVGLAPWANDRGRQQGYRSTRGGRGTVRQVLYLAALAAIRCNDDLKQFCQLLRARGKTGKVALVAVMRKLLLVLNAIAQRGTPWVEHHAPPGNKKA